ncbi:MAG: prolyl oligopeptidase family serine peptidase [Halothiobacillaceae bacterium]
MALPARIAGRAYPTFYKPEAYELLVFDPQLNVVASVDRPVLGGPGEGRKFFWETPGSLIFKVVDGLSEAIYRHDLASGETRRLLAGGMFRELSVLPDGQRVIFLWSRFDYPEELWIHDRISGLTERLTDNNRAAREAASVQRYQVSFTLADGSVRQGFWFAPADMAWPPREQPVVFSQAGGPGGSMVDAWGNMVDFPQTLLPSLGISVLMLPLQQRPGWGSEQWNALVEPGHFGSVDVDEMAEVARQLVARGWSRADQLGISGCSYGGYLTAQSITRHPGLWAAANPQCSLLDLVSEFQTGYADHVGYLFGSTPWDNWNDYLDASPAYQSAQVQTPTLIFHGAQDFLPVGITENWFQELRDNGVAVRMLRFEEEHHGLTHNANQIYAAQEQVRWFRKWLGNPAPEPTPKPEPESGGGGSVGWAGLLLLGASLLARRKTGLSRPG